jgi:hypothetical protein
VKTSSSYHNGVVCIVIFNYSGKKKDDEYHREKETNVNTNQPQKQPDTQNTKLDAFCDALMNFAML